MIRVNITICNALAKRLNALSDQNATTKSEIFRKALTLFVLA
jgi:metal-responsive CopG/Arc/MetJ family transcriptional regulator